MTVFPRTAYLRPFHGLVGGAVAALLIGAAAGPATSSPGVATSSANSPADTTVAPPQGADTTAAPSDAVAADTVVIRSAVDSGAIPVHTLRGTERPLPRQSSLLQKTGRAVLFVPYAAATAVTWPVTRLAYVEERYHPLGALASVLTFQRRRQGVVFRGSFGFESSTGIAIVGGSVIDGDWLGTGARLKLNGGYLDRDRNQAVLKLRTREAPVQGELLGRYDNREDRPFFGRGPLSAENDGEYNRERRLLEARLWGRLVAGVTASVAGYARGMDLTPTVSEESIMGLFPEEYALARDTRYRGVEGMVTLDRRDRGAFSTRGGLLRLVGGVNEDQTGDDAHYRHYAAEAQAFLNLYHGDRILALRAWAQGIDADDPDRVPFTELSTLGGKYGLRGFSRYRFTDQNALLLTAEYRYPVTTLFGARLVLEWGSVSADWDQLRLADVDPVIGLAIVTNTPEWPLTVQVSRSSEGLELYLGTENLFSYQSRRVR